MDPTSTQPPTEEAGRTQPKERLEREADAAKRVAQSATDAARNKAAELGEQVKKGAAREAESAKHSAAGSLHAFADAVRVAGEDLADSDQGAAASLVRQAATGLENLSTSLDSKQLPEMLEDIRDFGRQNPTAFIAGSVLVGLALGRFVRSSSANTPHDPPSPAGRTQAADRSNGTAAIPGAGQRRNS